MKATAVLHVRNEAEILRPCFDHILANGLDIAVIDNESDDRTAEIIASYSKTEVIRHELLEFDGSLNLPAILRKVWQLVADLNTDWILYQGADEMLQSARPGERLLEGMARQDQAGFSAINFHELVFVPTNRWFKHQDYVNSMRYYYFHQPNYPRLMRAWKNLPGISNFESGGHLISKEDVRVAEEDWILRHYIVRSRRHAREKYRNRKYSREGLDYGWHHNRINISWSHVALPPKRDLKYLAKDSCEFDFSDPWKKHFWQSYSR